MLLLYKHCPRAVLIQCWLVSVLWSGLVTHSIARQVQESILFSDVKMLADDAMQGRKTGTAGNQRAAAYLASRLKAIGLQSFHPNYNHPFVYQQIKGTNLIAYIQGQSNKYIVVSAHYDHLGMREGQIFNGADDNASGVAAVLQLATFLHQQGHPRYSWLFVFFDAEEAGLLGAKAFVENPPVPQQDIILNLNFDMLSRSPRQELYVCGTAHHPHLRSLFEHCTPPAGFHLLFGHDPTTPKLQDWTQSSDHYPFHQKGIPFLYFGVEDHPDYHRPTDDYEKIDRAFYLKVVEYLVQLVQCIDKQL